MAVTFVIIALVLLLMMAAYLAASETALLRVSRIRVRYLVEKKVRKADKLEKLVSNPDSFYPTVLLLMLAIQITSGSLATLLTAKISHNVGIGVAVGTIVVTFFMFVFGELVPKAAASHDSERVSLFVTRPITLLSTLLRPLALMLQWIAVAILKLFGTEAGMVDTIITEEGELITMVSVAEEHDVIEEGEKEMIHSIFEFGDTIVREVMVPRPDMFVLPGEMTIEEALPLIMEKGFSRIPGYGRGIDNILGVLYAKDMIKLLRAGKLETRVGDLLREANIIPETKRLGELLREQQKSRVHMSIVVDEYGTVVGLITIEDLLEQIVGDIFDEFDLEVKLVEKIDQNRYRVDARMNMDELNEELKISMLHEDVDTVGGLVSKILGKLPVRGETFVYNGVRFTVEKVTQNRISRVVLELVGDNPEEESG